MGCGGSLSDNEMRLTAKALNKSLKKNHVQPVVMSASLKNLSPKGNLWM